MNQILFNLRKKFIKAFNTGYLPEMDGHQIYFQQVGNPQGFPVIMFHGGPGGSNRTYYASTFDLKKYRVIMFDQRGCGKSQYKDYLYKNTTLDTIKDAVRLLDFLTIKEKVIVAGGSFGSTCAVLFAETYPQKVKKIVINSIFLARLQDAENTSPIASFFYPDAMDILQKQAGKENQFDYYYHLLFSKKRNENEQSVRYYRTFERMMGSLYVDFPKKETSDDEIRKFRIFMQYQKNGFYIKENQLIKEAIKIDHIPALIYQNRLDFCCPPYQAFELHKALPKSKLTIVADKGHGGEKLYFAMYQDCIRDV